MRFNSMLLNVQRNNINYISLRRRQVSVLPNSDMPTKPLSFSVFLSITVMVPL